MKPLHMLQGALYNQYSTTSKNFLWLTLCTAAGTLFCDMNHQPNSDRHQSQLVDMNRHDCARQLYVTQHKQIEVTKQSKCTFLQPDIIDIENEIYVNHFLFSSTKPLYTLL